MWKRRKFLVCLIILHLWLIEPADSKVDICSSLCRCVNESHFVKIHCDFIDNKDYVLDETWGLPTLGNALNVTLGDKSKLIVKNGFFGSRNRINSVVIQGLREDFKMTKSNVVLWTRAMDGVGGHFPEVCFRNLQKVVLSEKSLDGLPEVNLIVEGVWELTANKEVFGSTTPNASFNDIGDLVLNDGVLSTSSFNLTKPKIYINRSYIRHLYPLRGRKMTELRIENSEIGVIRTSAFTIHELSSLILDNVRINTIESDIFYKAIVLENLAVTNCEIDKIATKAINEVGITKFTFEKNIVNSIEGNSIEFAGSNINFAHNKINFMGVDWLKSYQWTKVNVWNNTFGSFDSISLENPTIDEDFECKIELNSFTIIQPNTLKSINERCQFKALLFKQNCSCKFNAWLATLVNDVSTKLHESYCSLAPGDILYNCLKAETVKFDQYNSEICSKKKSKLKCDKVKVEKIATTFIDPKVLSDEFDWHDYLHYIIPAVVGAVLIACICFIILIRRNSRNVTNNHYGHGTMMHHQTDLLQLNQSEGPPSYEASLRSTKTFSNRDHIIIKRTLETMKQKQPEDKYELVYNNTKRLIHEQLNEYEKVRIIGDIVQTIGECENSGEDFVAFTDILYKHLAPDNTTTVRNTTVPRPQAPPVDDVYAEPVLPQNTSDPSKVNSEHIYAEPTVLMQQQTMIPLLLANNYSNPLDNNNINNNNNVYSEPVIHEASVGSSSFKPRVVTPYAISENIDQQQPSTSKNLPDILNRMEAGPSGELNRITRSPTTNRKIPEYTVPSTSHKTPVRVTQDTIEDWSDESMEESTSSNHSGGSNATVKIDELIEYADNET